MAFHYQAQADLSDDEEGAVDLSQWQNGAKKSTNSSSAAHAGPSAGSKAQAPAPTAPMQPRDIDDSDDDLATNPLAAFQQSTLKRKRSPPAPVAQQSGFTPVNRIAPSVNHQIDVAATEPEFDANVIGQHDEVEEVERQEEQEQRQPELVPIIPAITRADLQEDEIVDLTAGDDVVRRVLAELESTDGEVVYRVEFEDYSIERIPFEQLITYDNGQEALEDFTANPPDLGEEEPEPRRTSKKSRMSSTRPGRGRKLAQGFVSTVDNIEVSDGEQDSGEEIAVASKRGRKRKTDASQYVQEQEVEEDDYEEEEDEGGRPSGLRSRLRNSNATVGRSLRSSLVQRPDFDSEDEASDDDQPFLQSDLVGSKPRRSRGRPRGQTTDFIDDDGIGFEEVKRRRVGERQSGRATRHQGGMKEVDVNDIYRDDSDDGTKAPAKPKAVGAREAFKTLPRNDEFRMRHNQDCETCGQGANFAQLIYCQGCSLAYHKSCLGHRTSREHLVTKIGDGDFVLQCRRCIAFPRKKDPTAPDQGKCSDCHHHGHACQPFRPRKTPAQEQKDRDENDGEDPSYDIHQSRINNAENVLFRCVGCWRGFHFEHLPSRSDMMDLDTEADAEQRFREYSRDWKCKDCLTAPAKVTALIAWKPVDEDNYDPALAFDMIDEEEKAYLVRWEDMSYLQATWMPGAWVWGTTYGSMRKAFAKRDEALHPKMRTEDAIPEDFLRADIVLDIKFTSFVDIRTEEVDKARIREVSKALIKYKGLGYEDAVWEAPPSIEDEERWSDFVTAYNDWVLGRYVRVPTAGKLKKTLERVRAQDFSKLEKTAQPETLQGGTLMQYQIEGLNWLYYKWFTMKNAILADEMGLGKTIQIIGFLATLVQDHNCFPFLIVVPNSTCPNWRREIKRWAPSLRVVAYYGTKESRDLAYRYEMFPENSKDLRCHIVVTSYDAAADENCRKFFRSVPWQGLIVDEGQRLKNDKNILYAALGALKAPFRILLTGTPLQNNQRELFNLLHFLDESYNAAELEERFQDLTQEKINELHDLIRPFFLRRTKAQVLTFLPPMAQIIVPVSMTLVQKKLYRTILAKNPDLMKAIFSADSTSKQAERASLSNILMQLRKCLCHPFVYNKSIEERNVSTSASHRNLVDASSKLLLLELLLPKLRERGHRVLIFSQFLDMLDVVEDFMEGMQFPYQRLDGSIGSLQKQKRIDEFNAPDSPLFAFLLSTRAGGVGINLASADTVIILDPDFNPHQDIQALSRAHRIGQSKKVLCFQLVTRASAEERIMQIGRKKLALDHVLIQEMDAEDAEQTDLVSVLRHGANELFEDNGDQDIVYDAPSIERLLDRSHMEDTHAGEDKSAETTFSFARVWANDAGMLTDDTMMIMEEQAPDPGVWANILKEREKVAAAEAIAKAEAFGRGRRARNAVDYANDKALDGAEGVDLTPLKGKKVKTGDESDTDFQADDSGADDDDYGGEELEHDDAMLLEGDAKRDAGHKKNGKTPQKNTTTSQSTPDKAKDPKASSTKPAVTKSTPKKSNAVQKASPSKAKKPTVAVKTSAPPVKKLMADDGKAKKPFRLLQPPVATAQENGVAHTPGSNMPDYPTFKRVTINHGLATPPNGAEGANGSLNYTADGVQCVACKTYHEVGSCPLKLAGVEYCNLCGMAHFGHARVCPHIQSETQVRAMLEALKYSTEPEHLVTEARRYLRGLKGNLVQLKKQKEAKEHAQREAEAQAVFHAARAPVPVPVWRA